MYAVFIDVLKVNSFQRHHDAVETYVRNLWLYKREISLQGAGEILCDNHESITVAIGEMDHASESYAVLAKKKLAKK